IDRSAPATNAMNRGKRSMAVDLKNTDGLEALLRLTDRADAFFEVFRPGVAERLGCGPDACLARNPRLVYGRLTGWGQEGPYAHAAGHDINYIALAGALHPIGRAGGPPVPPLNLVGDFGGGGMLLAFGVAAALVETARSGKGQVIDAAMVDGAAVLSTMFHGLSAIGVWREERGANLLDTGTHFYDVYETADAKYVSVGSIEPQFYAELRPDAVGRPATAAASGPAHRRSPRRVGHPGGGHREAPRGQRHRVARWSKRTNELAP